MATIEKREIDLRERALALASELGLDPDAWYLSALGERRTDGSQPEPGVLARAYWELYRVSGRPDVGDTWRSLADGLPLGDAA